MIQNLKDFKDCENGHFMFILKCFNFYRMNKPKKHLTNIVSCICCSIVSFKNIYSLQCVYLVLLLNRPLRTRLMTESFCINSHSYHLSIYSILGTESYAEQAFTLRDYTI